MIQIAIETIIKYWAQWICILMTTGIGIAYRSLSQRFKEERDANIAMREGIKALLHDRLIDRCEQCIAKQYCTTDELDEIYYMYKPYKSLNGNGTVDRDLKIVEGLPTMPVSNS